MELNEYQRQAMSTCMESCENDAYMLLNLVAEVGEFAGKMAKHIRKGEALMGSNDFLFSKRLGIAQGTDYLEELKKEAGDIMWQIAGLCYTMGWELEEVCQANLAKLASRKERGVIDGEGDNR
jgi:NTP pyrophosphatase (non-canonical NTP hydrolase)